MQSVYPMDFSIASPHKSELWYDYRLYVNLIEALESLGYKYRKNSNNRIYFLGAPRRHFYPDVGKFDSEANNLALAYCHFEKISSYNEFNKVFLPSNFVKKSVLNQRRKYSKIFKKNSYLDKVSKIEIIKPFSSLTPESKMVDALICDLSFIGSPRIRPIVEDIIPIVKKHNLSFHIYGPHWDAYKGNSLASSFVKAAEIPYQDIPKLSAASKISLVDHHQSMNDIGSVSHKYVDLLSSGAFIISDKNKDAIHNYNGVCYSSKSELEDLVLYYLENESERKKVLARQMNIVKDNSTNEAARQISKFFL